MAAGDVKLGRPAASAVTITLASLASDSALLAGRQSTAIDNSANLYLDFLLAGKIRTGASAPTAGKQIEVWVAGMLNDTPLWPSTLDGGADAAKTITSADIKASALALAAVLVVDATTGRDYFFKPVSVASLFGGVCPTKFSIFVTQNTGQNLDATGANHVISVTPSYMTIA